ncbi:unnamed protein product [Candidula unifasciata]|uniref:G-protein coupled receptors family 1 profile domain-containing protein n=1 Tax=Candidula unifasciata TaxID=100452 RepID=A0A8S3ZG72_9EUPU|nr:unnamed protein product [Candidula unifasciata]
MVVSPNNVTSLPQAVTTPVDGSLRGLQEREDFSIVVMETIVFVVLWILALLGNILVVLVIRRSRRMQSTTNYFVVSIAFSDLTLILLSAPFVCVRVVMQEWAAGHLMCRLVRLLQFFSTSSVSFILVAICIDRFYTIVHPLSFKVTRDTAKKMIVVGWGLSLIISSMCVYFFEQVVLKNADTGQQRYACPTFIPGGHWSGVLYACLCVVSQYLCPLILVVVGYSRTFIYIKSLRDQVRLHRRLNNPISRTKFKMVKMLMFLSALTFVLYLPFYATQMFHTAAYKRLLSAQAFISSFWLICASAAAKPTIYACGNSNFWRGCKEVLCMSTMRCYRLNTYIVTNASSVSKNNYVGVIDLSKDQTSIRVDSPLEPFSAVLYEGKGVWQTSGSLPSASI